MEIEELKEELKKYIKNEKRYKHSLGTMKMCKTLANKYNIDEKNAEKTGLMHDIAKEIIDEEAINYVNGNNIEITEIEKINPKLLHGKIGADICRKKYNFDEEMCNAIKWHTTGRANMSLLEKIIFCADKIEENRSYEDVEYYRNLAMQDIDQAVLEIIDWTIKSNIEKGKLLLEKSIETRNYILINRKK